MEEFLTLTVGRVTYQGFHADFALWGIPTNDKQFPVSVSRSTYTLPGVEAVSRYRNSAGEKCSRRISHRSF